MKTLMNGVEVTVVEMKKGGWVSIQLSNGDVKSVRKNMIEFVNDVVDEVIKQDEEDVMNELDFESTEELMMDDIVDTRESKLAEMMRRMNEMQEEADLASSAEIQSIIAQANAENAINITNEIERWVNKGIGYIHAVNILESYKEGSEEWVMILGGILRFARGFKYSKSSFDIKTPVNSVLNYRVTGQQYIMDNLEWYENNVDGSGKGLVQKFKDSLHYTNTYRFETDDEVKELISKKRVNPKFEDLIFVPVVQSPIQVVVRNAAIILQATRGNVIGMTDGQGIFINTDTIVGITVKDASKGITNLVDKVIIHPQYASVNARSGKEELYWNEYSIGVKGNSLVKLFLIKANKINLDVLVNDKSGLKAKVVGLNLDNKLEEIVLPGCKMSNTYSNTGMVSISEAKSGIISTIVDINAVAKFKGGQVFSIDNVNKAIARADKQEKENGWDIGTHKVFLVKDARKETLNKLLGTGSIYVPESFLNRFMMARITSKMINGGIKAATNYIESDLDCMVVGPAAFKGGEFGLMKLLGLPVEMEDFLDKKSKRIEAAREYLDEALETITFAGEEVEGWFLDIPLRMTNATGIEQYQYAEQIQNNGLLNRTVILSGAQETPNGLRDLIMSKACEDENFSTVAYILQGLKTGVIVEKKNETRHTASIFQTAVQWHGHKAVMSLIRSLINNMTSGHGGKKLGVQYLTGDITPTVRLQAEDIANAMIHYSKESNKPLLDGVNTYPKALLNFILEETEADLESRKCEWFSIMFGNEEVLVPSNGHLYAIEQGMETEYTFLANSFLADVLNYIKKSINVQYDAENNSTKYFVKQCDLVVNGKFLQAAVQSSLFGKTFGYLNTVGSYQMILPTVDMDQLDHEMQVTDPTMFEREEDEYNNQGYLAVNGCKYPAYFEDAFAGYVLHHTDLGSNIVNFAMRKAVFMTHEAIMIMQNDADGDLHQISNDCYQLPLFKGPRQGFNASSFIKFIEDEREGNIIKAVKGLNISSMEDFHKAMESAVKSKDAIGLYTATKYKYETLFEGVTNFISTSGDIIEVDSKLRHTVISTMAYLCQVEAMDNIKQSGSNEAIMERLAIHKLSNIVEKLGETSEQAIKRTLESIISSLELLFTKEGWNVPTSFATTMTEICYYAAGLTSNPMRAFNIYSNRACTKRFEVITEELSGGDVSESFDFFGTYGDIFDSVDSNSMYAYLTKQLVKAFSN